jgi:hypothetical protein
MHTDLIERILARRLRALADEPAEAPYDWAEFERRRQSAAAAGSVGRQRLAAMAAAGVAALVIAGLVIVRSIHHGATAVAQVSSSAHAGTLDREQAGDGRATGAPAAAPSRRVLARTQAIEGWLARLPHDPGVVRVGTRAAVTSLQDQIAELDDLMSAERVAGAQPARLDALELQRAQLVSSLAQLRYAEMLASAAS